MPRQGRSGRSAPSRPTVAPQRPSAPQQTRSASTTAYPPTRTNQAGPPVAAPGQQQQQGSAGSGMVGNIASTAMYVFLHITPEAGTDQNTEV
jgi:hypothetical protein